VHGLGVLWGDVFEKKKKKDDGAWSRPDTKTDVFSHILDNNIRVADAMAGVRV
jgi:hypothetical protein